MTVLSGTTSLKFIDILNPKHLKLKKKNIFVTAGWPELRKKIVYSGNCFFHYSTVHRKHCQGHPAPHKNSFCTEKAHHHHQTLALWILVWQGKTEMATDTLKIPKQKKRMRIFDFQDNIPVKISKTVISKSKDS